MRSIFPAAKGLSLHTLRVDNQYLAQIFEMCLAFPDAKRLSLHPLRVNNFVNAEIPK